MSKRQPFIDLKPVQKETLSAKEFLRLSTERPHSISKSRFVVPTIGGRDFGGFEVEYYVPILKRVAA